MLLGIVFTTLLLSGVLCSEGEVKQVKPYMFPVPFELPNRNDRSDQCWLRIEDVELIETVTVYCYIARDFLYSYIRDYNSRKMMEDKVDVSLWIESPRLVDDDSYNKQADNYSIKDWKVTTIMDPITLTRLYVSKNADCRLVMYSREGMSNYLIECEKILYYVNDRMTGNAAPTRSQYLILSACLCVYIYVFNS